MKSESRIWRTPDGERWFLIPAREEGPPGSLALHSPEGAEASVHPAWARRFEVGEAEGRAFAREELGEALSDLRGGIDEVLAAMRRRLAEAKRCAAAKGGAVDPEALSAMLSLLKELPWLVGNGLSVETGRVEAARSDAAGLERRLGAAGLDLDGRLEAFPDRLRRLREEFAQRGPAS